MSNFTQCTIRVPGVTGWLAGGVGPQESLAMLSLRVEVPFDLTASCDKFLVHCGAMMVVGE
ncbi:MAG: hypothetical protein NVS9B4_14300 [Candidatus Acidiferrum sp.]